MRDEAYDHADPYGDGTYGTNATPASTNLEADLHEDYARQQDVVWNLARDAQYRGITGADVKRATGWDDSPKSRALSTLLRTGALVRLAERRERAHVHVTADWVGGRETLPYESTNAKYRRRALQEAHAIVSATMDKWSALEAIEALITTVETDVLSDRDTRLEGS